MALGTFWYGQGVHHLSNGAVDWDTDTIKCSLHTSTYAPNQDTHDFYNDATNEITSANYTAGGVTVPNRTRAYDAATNESRLLCDNIVFGALTASPAFAVVYKSRGGVASADELICWVDLGGTQTLSGVVFEIRPPSGVLLKTTVL